MSILNELENYLSEMSIQSVNITPRFRKQFHDNIDWGNELLANEYIYDNGRDEDEIYNYEEVYDTEEFKEWFDEYTEGRFYEMVDILYSYIDNGKIKIWRMMDVKKDWIDALEKQGKHLGIYWSYEEDVAEAHWGKGLKHSILIESEVPENGVDWNETILANIHPVTGEEEKEITLFKGTPINIKSIKVDNEEIDITHIKDKVFKA